MKILLAGFGAMNERVARLAESRGHDIIGIISLTDKTYPYPTVLVDSDYPDADVIIDFSHPDLSQKVISNSKDIPLVMATTGRKEELISALKNVSTQKPVFFSANMSYGVHIMTEIIRYATPLLLDYDVEIMEKHHRRKVDAPSGTLIKLLDAVKEQREAAKEIYDRSLSEEPRTDNEIGIQVVRGGTIVGEHEVLFAGHDETIQIIHRAQSKDIFANGSIDVAERLIDQPAGYYTFDNL